MERLLTETTAEKRARERAYWAAVHKAGDKNRPFQHHRARGDVMRTRSGSPTFTQIGVPPVQFG